MKRWKDKFGIAASTLCAIHCAVTPILLSTLPSLRLTGWMASPLFHQAAALICMLFVGIAIVPSVRRTRDYTVGGLALAGVAMLLFAAFVLPDTCCTVGGHIADGQVVGGGQSPASHNHESLSVSFAGVDWDLNGMLASAHPWLTPIGGMFLILAHLLNLSARPALCRNKRCACQSGNAVHSIGAASTAESLPNLSTVSLSSHVVPKAAESSSLELQRAC